MSKKILRMPTKARVASSDWLPIIDGSDSNPKTQNKRATKSAMFQQKTSNASATPSIALSANVDTFIACTTPLTSLTITGDPSVTTWETEIQFTTDATFAFTATGLQGKWVGGAPTFEPNKTYVIAIKNGLAAWGEVS